MQLNTLVIAISTMVKWVVMPDTSDTMDTLTYIL